MADVLDDLISSAYRSLTGPDGHAAFMRLLAQAFRSHVIAHQLDRPGHLQSVSAHYDHDGRGMDDLAVAASRQPYVNPWFASPQVRRLFQEGIADEQGCIGSAALRATEFYADILQPFDIFHSVGFLLEQGDGAAVMTISRSARNGSYEAHELLLAKKLLPHLRNIHAIQKVVAQYHLATGTPSHPLWLLAANGRICGRNQHTSRFISTYSAVGERGGMLWPVLPRDRTALHAEISNVLGGIRLSGRVPIRDEAGTPRYIAHIQYCRREAFLTWLITDPPAALVVLHPLDCDPSLLEPVLVRLYGLTTAECRVAAKLLELESIHLVAASLNRSEETIRSQIKAVFSKTGTHSQAQLLKLLYALAAG